MMREVTRLKIEEGALVDISILTIVAMVSDRERLAIDWRMTEWRMMTIEEAKEDIYLHTIPRNNTLGYSAEIFEGNRDLLLTAMLQMISFEQSKTTIRQHASLCYKLLKPFRKH
jgi:hypothetical protein